LDDPLQKSFISFIDEDVCLHVTEQSQSFFLSVAEIPTIYAGDLFVAVLFNNEQNGKHLHTLSLCCLTALKHVSLQNSWGS